MQVRELAVRDSYEFTPVSYPDARGVFVAPYQEEPFLRAVGYPLRLAQSNHSQSRRNTLRGLHFADVPPGQAKYVYCARGAVLDVVVDLRVGSPTFGAWDAVHLDPVTFRALYLPEGVGHAYLALEDDTVFSYICSSGYNPAAERGVRPTDPALGLPWPADLRPLMSDRDRAAPTLAEARAAGLLPRYDECVAWYEHLRATAAAMDVATGAT
jgi:epimerase EvaD